VKAPATARADARGHIPGGVNLLETIELVGAIARMVELRLDAKQAALGEAAVCSVKVVAGAGFEPATFRL
jgi:hypothetical protein